MADEQLTGKARTDRMMKVRAQQDALKAWQRAGSPEGERPDTPDYDAMTTKNIDNGGRAMAKPTTTTGTGRAAATVTYCRGGKPINRSRYFLGFMANDTTKHIGGDDVKRLTTAGFRDMLASVKILDPENTTWQVELPNGEIVGAFVKGDKLPKAIDLAGYKPKPGDMVRGGTARKPKAATAPKAATKSPARAVDKATAKKAAATKRAPAKKTAVAKKVTTNFKTPKKAAAKKTVAAARSTRRTAKR